MTLPTASAAHPSTGMSIIWHKVIDNQQTADNPTIVMGERNFIDLDTSPSPATLETLDSSSGGIRELCSVLERTVKTVCLYPPTNPLPDEFRQKFFDALSRQLERGRIPLTTTDSSFLCDGARVYERPGTEENLAYLLFRDGIREVVFEPGVDREECDRFIAVLVGAFSMSESARDVANRLWEAGLSHIRHYTVDRVVSGTYIDMADDRQLAQRHEQFLQSGTPDIQPGTEPVRSGEPDTPYEGAQQERYRYVTRVFGEVTQLSDADQTRISSLAEGDSPRSPEKLGLGILFEVTRDKSSPMLVEESLAVLEKQYDRFIQTDAWDLARIILEGWRHSPQDMTENSTKRLQQALTYASESRHFERLARYLNANPNTDLGEIQAFLELFDMAAIKPITAMLSELEHRPARNMVCRLLAKRGAGGVDLIGGFVYDKRWYVVRNVTMVLGEIGSERAVGYLRKAAGHQDKRVRQEALRAIRRIEGLDAARVLLAFLDDEELDMRLNALRGIKCEHGPACLAELKRRAEDASLVNLEPDEIRELLMAYSRAGGPSATARLLHLAKRSTLFSRRWIPVKLAAIEALGSCQSSEGRAHLEIMAQSRNRDISQTARAALKARSAKRPVPVPAIQEQTEDIPA